MNSWNCISTNKNEAFLIQLALHSSGQRGSILTNQDSAFCTKFWQFRVLIRMRTDQSQTRGGEFCPYKWVPLWLWKCTFPFHPPGWGETQRYPWSRAEQISAGQSRLAQEQSRPLRRRAELSSQKGVWHQGCLAVMLFLQLCCITVELFYTE